MSGIFGAINLDDTERVFASTTGQTVVYEFIQELLQRYNAGVQAALGIFVETQTEGFKERYKLPGGGRLQRRAIQTQAAAVKAYGGYDVAYPLEDFGAQVGGDDVSMAYMTAGDLERHITTVMIQNDNTVRWELLHALVDSAQGTFIDPLHGSLSIEPLANSDTVTYPPVLGSESEATENHYLYTSYAAASISDTNNPFITIRDELEEHFGATQGGSNIIVFINQAQRAVVEDLTDFDPVNDRYTRPGDDTDTIFGLPSGMVGQVLGRTNGVWVVEWRWCPASYMIAIDTDAPGPLKWRVDPADTGLSTGLQLVAREETYPMESSHWRNRFGLGCGNRLNGVVMDLLTTSSYTVPTAYD